MGNFAEQAYGVGSKHTYPTLVKFQREFFKVKVSVGVFETPDSLKNGNLCGEACWASKALLTNLGVPPTWGGIQEKLRRLFDTSRSRDTPSVGSYLSELHDLAEELDTLFIDPWTPAEALESFKFSEGGVTKELLKFVYVRDPVSYSSHFGYHITILRDFHRESYGFYGGAAISAALLMGVCHLYINRRRFVTSLTEEEFLAPKNMGYSLESIRYIFNEVHRIAHLDGRSNPNDAPSIGSYGRMGGA